MYHFVINPSSGSGRGLSVWITIKHELDRLEVPYRFTLLKGPGEAGTLAQTLSQSDLPCTLAVIGGDGTINETLNGLTDFSNITFACIPTGSGNDFVRGLHLEQDPVKALHRILQPAEVLPVNVGQTLCRTPDGKTSSFAYGVSTGIGFDASVCNAVLHSRLKKVLNRFHFGKLIYLFTALWQLFTMRRCPLTVTLDDGRTLTFQKVYFAAAMNLPYEGGGFQFAPEALPGDDCIDLIIASGIPRLRVLTLLPLAMKGQHVGKRGVHLIRCKKASIHAERPLCIHTDGEIPGFYADVDFSLKKEKLAVILR